MYETQRCHFSILTFFMYCISIKLIRMTLLISKKVLILCSFTFSTIVTSIASERAMRSASGISGNVSSNQLRIIFFSDSIASILAFWSLKLSRPRQTSLNLNPTYVDGEICCIVPARIFSNMLLTLPRQVRPCVLGKMSKFFELQK